MGAILKGKVAIVTGSSSGIGKAIALRLARERAAVCGVADQNVQGGEATAEEIRDAGGRSLFVRADVRVDKDCRRIVEETLKAFAQVDVLVNNAGITSSCPLEEMDEAFWATGTAPRLSEQRWSCVLLTRSFGAEGGIRTPTTLEVTRS